MANNRFYRIDPLNIARLRRGIRQLRRFRDLVCLQTRWGQGTYKTLSFEELFPKADIEDEYGLLRVEINELIPKVQRLFSIADISTSLVSTDKEYQGLNESSVPIYKDKKDSINILDNYFLLSSQESFKYREYLIDAVNRGIGHLSELKKLSWKACLNPLRWIGITLRLPLIILEYAHLIEDEKSRSIFVQIYAWVIRILMLVFISLAIRKLGLDIDWRLLK